MSCANKSVIWRGVSKGSVNKYFSRTDAIVPEVLLSSKLGRLGEAEHEGCRGEGPKGKVRRLVHLEVGGHRRLHESLQPGWRPAVLEVKAPRVPPERRAVVLVVDKALAVPDAQVAGVLRGRVLERQAKVLAEAVQDLALTAEEGRAELDGLQGAAVAIDGQGPAADAVRSLKDGDAERDIALGCVLGEVVGGRRAARSGALSMLVTVRSSEKTPKGTAGRVSGR